MELRQLLPLGILAVVALLVLRFVIGAIKFSAKFLVWGVFVAGVLGIAYLWYQGNPSVGPPPLSIPAP